MKLIIGIFLLLVSTAWAFYEVLTKDEYPNFLTVIGAVTGILMIISTMLQ